MPQSIYYCISNDNLVALTSGLAIYVLFKCWVAPVISMRLGLLMGLALAGMFLTKLTALPLIVAVGLFFGGKLFLLYRAQRLSSSLAGAGLGIVGFAVPTLGWVIWCQTHFQSWTGNGEKIGLLGWSEKPFAEWFQHPIYTTHGVFFFIFRNVATFWQGEARWHLQLLRHPIADWIYFSITMAAILTVVIALKTCRDRLTSLQKLNFVFTMVGLIASFGFLGWLSVRYDFNRCWYPSRVQPFFTSGRLLLGSLIPVAILVGFSLNLWLRSFQPHGKYIILIIFLMGLLATEAMIASPLYSSWYNMVHLLAKQDTFTFK
jgi:hypothetical protein